MHCTELLNLLQKLTLANIMHHPPEMFFLQVTGNLIISGYKDWNLSNNCP